MRRAKHKATLGELRALHSLLDPTRRLARRKLPKQTRHTVHISEGTRLLIEETLALYKLSDGLTADMVLHAIFVEACSRARKRCKDLGIDPATALKRKKASSEITASADKTSGRKYT